MLAKDDIFKRYYNVLTETEKEICLEFLSAPTWAFGAFSNSLEDPIFFYFWQKQLIYESFFNELFFNKIKLITGMNFEIDRIYANGQTYGQPGVCHIDSEREDAYTFLYYSNFVWEAEWGGDTVFFLENNERYYAQYIPNSGILFKSNTRHAGLAPERFFTGLRTTIAYKLIKKDN